MSFVRRVAAALLLFAAALPAQDTLVAGASDGRKDVEITYTRAARIPRPGGLGFVVVKLKNLDTTRRRVALDVEDSMRSLGHFGARKSLELEGGATAVVRLPIGFAPNGLRMRIRVDGREHSEAPYIAESSYGGTEVSGPAVLIVEETTAQAVGRYDALINALDDAAVPGHKKDVGHLFALCTSEDVPDDWTLLSRSDVIVVACDSPSLDAPRQRALIDWVRAGGSLAATDAAKNRLPEGPLAKLVRATRPDDKGVAVKDVGAGGVVVFHSAVSVSDAVVRAIGAHAVPPDERCYSASPVDGWYARLEIPFLGEVPVRTFLVFIVVYLAFIGVMARRFAAARKPAKLLVFLPVCGLVATVLILGFGIFSEGLGVKGAVRSFALLDQRERAVAAFSNRSLFAAFEPDDIPLPEGTTAYSIDVMGRDFETQAHRYFVDLDGGRKLHGSIIPARRPTQITTTSVEAARDRQRFKRRADGGLDVLAEAAFKPRGDLPLVVFDRASNTWFSGVGRSLALVSESEGRAAVERLLDAMVAVRTTTANERELTPAGYAVAPTGKLRAVTRWSSPAPTPQTTKERDRLVGSIRAAALRSLSQGGWFGAIEGRPSFVPSLGMDPTYAAEVHLVAGVMAEDDIGL